MDDKVKKNLLQHQKPENAEKKTTHSDQIKDMIEKRVHEDPNAIKNVPEKPTPPHNINQKNC